MHLDPPYYAKGAEIYRNFYVHENHEDLAALVQSCIKQPWFVSYDAVPEILKMYGHRRQLLYDLSYSAKDRYSGLEVMFFSDDIAIPQVDHPAKVNHRIDYPFSRGTISIPQRAK